MRRDFTSKKKWEINGISGFDAKKETEGGADIANESYLQTVFRRFRRHHLALISLIVLTMSRTRLWVLSAARPVRNSGWERTR